MLPNKKPYFDVANTAEGVHIYVPDKIKVQHDNFHTLHKEKYHKDLIYYYIPIRKLSQYLTFEKDPPFSKLRICGRMRSCDIVESFDKKHSARLCFEHVEFQDLPDIYEFYEFFGIVEQKNRFSVYFFNEIESEKRARDIEEDLIIKQTNYYD